MIDPRLTELMNLEIDGVATPSQRAELEQALASNPEARSHFEALVATVRRLDNHPFLEPPAELHPRVMESVDRAMRVGPARAPGWFARPLPRFMATFGLGLATGVFLFAVVRSDDFLRAVNPDHVSGTIGSPARLAPLATIPVDAPEVGATGSVNLFRTGQGTRADVRLGTGDPVAWTLSYDPASPEPYVIKIVKDGSVVFERAAQPVVP